MFSLWKSFFGLILAIFKGNPSFAPSFISTLHVVVRALSYLFICFCRSLGGAEYTEALCSMEKRSPEFSGEVFFCDPRLVANGFKVRLVPGTL